MRALRLLLITVAVAALLAGTAYGAGRAYRHLGDESASSSPTRSGEPAPEGAPTPSPSTSPSTPETSAPVEPVEPPKPAAVLEPGATGEQVRELQHRLFQMAWLPETTTGTYDATTKEAVAGFQGKRGFKATGVVDKKTWTKLVAMTKTPTHDQLFNVLKPGPALLASGASGDAVRDAQARLKQIAWLSGDVTGTYDATTVAAVKGFQAKRAIPVTGEIDQRTMDRLTSMTRTPTDGEKHNKAPSTGSGTNAPLDPRCATGRALCVDKSSSTVRWVVDGKVQATYAARFGSDELPTREGAFSVLRKSRDHVSTIYHTSMPLAMFFSGGQAVHYSPDFAANGYNGNSHGCVNVRDYNGMVWLFDQVSVGDKVIVYWS
jgi:peptidoglycan hydrolase-like protein with peptidoglycan-binding domain